jgi:ABC-type amino acid transport substrate-binding protein
LLRFPGQFGLHSSYAQTRPIPIPIPVPALLGRRRRRRRDLAGALAGLRRRGGIPPFQLFQARLGHYDIVLDGVKSPVRERDFLFPRPHYTITPVFVYLSHRPKPDMRSKQAMGLLRVCSLADYNYEPYGIPPSSVINSPRSVKDAARMLRLGRCDVLIYVEDVLRGHAAVGGLDVINNADFSREVPLWIERVGFYFLVGRKLAYRDELVELLDRGIAGLKADGELERLHRHAVGGPR